MGFGVGLGTAAVLVAVGATVGALIDGADRSQCTFWCTSNLFLIGGSMIGAVVGLVVGPLVGWLVGWSLGRPTTPQPVTLLPIITPAQAGLGVVFGL